MGKYSPGSLQSPGLLSGHHGNNGGGVFRGLIHGPGSGGLPGIDALNINKNLNKGDEDVEMKWK